MSSIVPSPLSFLLIMGMFYLICLLNLYFLEVNGVHKIDDEHIQEEQKSDKG